MEKAVERVAKAIIDRESIMVFGDYDVDGITSTFLIVKYLKLLGISSEFHIPNRFSEGYGINSEAIRLAKEKQVDLFIAVDSGTNAVSEIEELQSFGIDVIVLDHHVQTAEPLPGAVAIVNPNRLDQMEIGNSHIKHLCAAGVVFIFLMALRRHLKNRPPPKPPQSDLLLGDTEHRSGVYLGVHEHSSTGSTKEETDCGGLGGGSNVGFMDDANSPDLLQFNDVVALGTLCDVVDLRGINRAIVKYFLKHGPCSTGIKAMMRAFGINRIDLPEDLSFLIGPAINAAGRIGDPMIALQSLLEEDDDKAHELAKNLLNLNERRKILEKELMAEVMVMISEMDTRPPPKPPQSDLLLGDTEHRSGENSKGEDRGKFGRGAIETNGGIFLYGEGWHEGVLGIIAGRIKEKFCKPTFVMSFDSNGKGKGSARSIPGFHIGHFFDKAKKAGVITEGGGHALAGGFSMNFSDVFNFQKFLIDNTDVEFVNQLLIDYEIKISSQLSSLANELKILEPFGKGMEKPLFCLREMRIKSISKTKTGAHLMIILSGHLGDRDIRGFIFNISMKQKFVSILEQKKNNLLDLVGFISSNPQFGTSFIIEDADISR
jgi:single-stranded-DNA-specific exonuclease